MNRVLAIAPLISRTCTRRIATTQMKQVKDGLSKIKEKQRLFQVDNDIPIYLKGGEADKALYYLTLIMTFVGMGISGKALYKLMQQ